MREAILLSAARAYADLMSEVERADLDRRIVRLEVDPSVDDRTTFGLPDVSGFFIYDDGIWRMTYAVPDDATVVIRSIKHALDLPE